MERFATVCKPFDRFLTGANESKIVLTHDTSTNGVKAELRP